MKILDIKIELESKNIIVTSMNEDLGVTVMKGYSPMIEKDWEGMDENELLSDYKDFFWKDLKKPSELINNYE